LWGADKGATTLVLIHHGLGEHAGRYDSVAAMLAETNVVVASYDMAGHGTSPRASGDAGTLGDLSSTLHQMIPLIMEATKTTSVVLMGHSLGAAVVGHYLTTMTPHAAISKAVLSAPPVSVHRTLTIQVKIAAAHLMARLNPSGTLANEISSSQISSVQAEADRYASDPLIHDRISFALGLSIIQDAEQIPNNAGTIKMPVLMFQGSEDIIVERSGTEELYENLGSTEKSLHFIEGSRHECHHETAACVAEVAALLVGFLAV
jgi:alpha-beta hydrolase superfamily lysophospholipase